jgi:hypothetical protein
MLNRSGAAAVFKKEKHSLVIFLHPLRKVCQYGLIYQKRYAGVPQPPPKGRE